MEVAGNASSGSITRVQRSVTEHHSGPLPDPETLKRYDEAVPGAAQIIVEQFQKQSDHRIALENRVIDSDIKRSSQGLIAGFVVSMTAIVGGCIVAAVGHPASGATIATTAVVGLAGVFVYGTASRRREREKRTETLAEQK